MNIGGIYAWGIYAIFLPFLLIVLILFHYSVRRILWRRARRRGKGRLGFYPSAFALGMAFQFIQVYYKPSVAYALEAKQDEDADDDDSGDPETLARQLSRQLRRIRRGEPIDRLVLRL